MTRSPTPASTGPETTTVAYLFEVVYRDPSDGSETIIRLTTASQPVTVDADGDGSAETYDAAKGLMKWGGESETTDRRGQGALLRLTGVDRTVMSALLQNDFRGQRVRIWRAQGDPSTGTWGDTTLVHRGLQLDDYEVRENVPESENDPVTAEIETRSTSRMVALQATNEVKCNRRSQEAMLRRKGIAGDDTGMFYTKQLPGRIFWGSEQPDEALSGENAGGSAGTRGGGGGRGGDGGGDQPGGDDRFRP